MKYRADSSTGHQREAFLGTSDKATGSMQYCSFMVCASGNAATKSEGIPSMEVSSFCSPESPSSLDFQSESWVHSTRKSAIRRVCFFLVILGFDMGFYHYCRCYKVADSVSTYQGRLSPLECQNEPVVLKSSASMRETMPCADASGVMSPAKFTMRVCTKPG